MTTKTSSHRRSEQSKERLEIEKVDFERESEAMTELYGSRADDVLALEMELQLKFNKICDQNQPTIWPCIPLNLKFDYQLNVE